MRSSPILKNEQQLWNQGVPLGESIIKFGPTEAVDRLQKIRGDIDLVLDPKVAEEISKKPFSFGKLALGVLGGAVAISDLHNRKAALIKELQESLRGDLCSGFLFAFGFRSPRRKGAKPQRIPPDVFAVPKINWDNSECSGAGLQFLSVRICHSQLSNMPNSDHSDYSVTPIKVAKMGRPSRGNEIREAYSQLTNSGTITSGTPNKIRNHIVRDQIIRNSVLQPPDTRGLSDKSINKEIKEFLRAKNSSGLVEF